MSLVNEILAFCPNNTGTNLETQAAYSADSNRTNGNQPGVASSMLVNKAMRQAAYIASQMGEMLKTVNNQSVLDNATPAQLLQQMLAALQRLPPKITAVTATGSGTYNLPYAFFCASASATVAATYSDGVTTFTVLSTISSGTILYASGGTAPVTGGDAGTLTKTGGTGDTTITYYAVRSPLWLEVEMVGPGGGGGGAGTTGATDGADGSAATTFGTTLLSAGPGLKGSGGSQSMGGAGGASSLGTGPTGLALAGSNGGAIAAFASALGANTDGGEGGASVYGGGGETAPNVAGTAGATNSGSGGAGGGGNATVNSTGGSGGGSGGYVRAKITTVLSTYAYLNGTGGAAGTAGTSGQNGGAGANGRLLITANYQ